jgi:mannan endo-1,4-beta-mannosidase
MPWQFGQLGLTEDGGNKIFKYEDALIDGVCPGTNLQKCSY